MGTETPKTHGFAGLTPEQRRELGRKGGRNAHRKGTARQWTQETARAAGIKGAASRKAKMAQQATA